nr:unnamed protein product [Callosobruchus chinensis]
MYADDTSLLVDAPTVPSLATSATEEFTRVSMWFADNGLVLNRDKSLFVHFMYSSAPDYSLLVKSNQGTIKQSLSVKFLGLYMSYNCKWDLHIEYVCKKIIPITYCINRLRFIVGRSVMLTYYYSYFQSAITYGIIAWGASPQANRIFIIQKRVMSLMAGVDRRTSCKTIFVSMRILTLASIYIFELLVYIKTNLTDFRSLSHSHEYNTRNGLTLEVPAHRLSKTESSPNYMSIKLYNKLPEKIKQMDLRNYKNNIKELLLNKAYYSTKEYLSDTFD